MKPKSGSAPPVRGKTIDGRLAPIDWRLEWLVIGAIVAVALAIRLYGLGVFPDTVLADEADNVQSAARILHGQPPENGLFGLDWTQQPAFSVYKQALFLAIFGFNIMAMRLPSALISALALLPFYIIARRQMSAIAAALAALLLATNVWYLNFSRSGWNCIDIGCYMLLAMLTLVLALDAAALGKGHERRAYAWFAASGLKLRIGLVRLPRGEGDCPRGPGLPSVRAVLLPARNGDRAAGLCDLTGRRSRSVRAPGRLLRRQLAALQSAHRCRFHPELAGLPV